VIKDRFANAYQAYVLSRYLGGSVWVSLQVAWDSLLGR
jgi:hypothetical protein